GPQQKRRHLQLPAAAESRGLAGGRGVTHGAGLRSVHPGGIGPARGHQSIGPVSARFVGTPARARRGIRSAAAPVAQLARALVFGTKGGGFESLQAYSEPASAGRLARAGGGVPRVLTYTFPAGPVQDSAHAAVVMGFPARSFDQRGG